MTRSRNIQDRIKELLSVFGVTKAHFAGGGMGVIELCLEADDLAASLTLVNPINLAQAQVGTLGVPLALISAEQGPFDQHSLSSLNPEDITHHLVLKDYEGLTWSDVIQDRTEEVGTSLLEFLGDVDGKSLLQETQSVQASGTVAEITYRAYGAGYPLVLFPIGLAGNQWEPLVEKLAAEYCVIIVGGKHVSPVSTLEFRAATPGYQAMLQRLTADMKLSENEKLLEVGCGSGAVARHIATDIYPNALITAVDVNRFLLDQAKGLRDLAGLESKIAFREADAHALPFDDNTFDATISVTMLEEVDADKVLNEIVRVTRPGGHIGVVVRAIDMPGTLRAIHKLKHEGRAKAESENRRLELLPKMYGNPARRREELELERLELEMKQMRAEIAATVAETAAKSRDRISDMARSGIKAEKQSDQKVTALAKDGMLGRRKKCSTVS